MKRICVIGLGYVGLPTAAVLATSGFDVVGVDVRSDVVDLLNRGRTAICEEEGLSGLVERAVEGGTLRAGTEPEEADVFIICVGTPLSPDGKKADLGQVISAAESLVPRLRAQNLVVLESTVPPKTTTETLVPILERSGLSAGKDLHVAFCPERVLPGNILKELVRNDRIIGGITPESSALAREVYTSFAEGELYVTDALTAEVVKLMENTYRDLEVAAANELALISEDLGIDVWEAIGLANRHPRINILRPGPGVGGHCIPVDPWFLLEASGVESRVIASARSVNDGMPGHVVRRLEQVMGGLKGKKVAVLGLAYKGGVGDVRESPAISVIKLLDDSGGTVGVHDPYACSDDISLVSATEAADGASAILLLTDHPEFRELDPMELGRGMRERLIFDTRHLIDAGAWREAGFTVVYLGNGRGPQG